MESSTEVALQQWWLGQRGLDGLDDVKQLAARRVTALVRVECVSRWAPLVATQKECGDGRLMGTSVDVE